MTQFETPQDAAEFMREPTEPPEWFDHQVKAFQDKVVPWLEDLQKGSHDREDVRRMIIDKMRLVVGVEVDVRCYTTGDGTASEPVAYDIHPIRNLEQYDPERQGHEVRNNLLDIPEDRHKGVIHTDKGMVKALAEGDVSKPKLWTPGS